MLRIISMASKRNILSATQQARSCRGHGGQYPPNEKYDMNLPPTGLLTTGFLLGTYYLYKSLAPPQVTAKEYIGFKFALFFKTWPVTALLSCKLIGNILWFICWQSCNGFNIAVL